LNGLYEAAAEIQGFCQKHRWRFCVIGGLALTRWGSPRQTLDVDLTILAGFGGEGEVIEALVSAFRPRRADAAEFALHSRVVLIAATNGVPIDVSLGGLPFEEEMIERASPFEYLPGVAIMTASAEDMIILKAFAGRDKDWADVATIITRQAKRLDWTLILAELAPLCELKDSPETMTRLQRLREEFSAE
jgi:hypothetical protein